MMLDEYVKRYHHYLVQPNISKVFKFYWPFHICLAPPRPKT